MLQYLTKRQHGINSGNDLTSPLFDCVLSKLTCHQDDEHPGILSTSNSAASSDLLYACKFAQAPGFEHILALANEDGKIALQNTNTVGKSRPIHGYQAHENAIFDLCWAPASWKIITASGDQTCVLLDIGTSSINSVAKFSSHTASIKTVDFSPTSSSVFASGSRDGSIMLWDARDNSSQLKPENTIKNAHYVNGPSDVRSSRSKRKPSSTLCAVNSVTNVVFQNENTLLSTGAADGNIHVWDLRKNYTLYKGDPLPKTKIPYGGLSSRSGITSLSLNPGKTLLYASSMDDVIYEFNAVSYEETPIAVYGGHEQHSFYIKTCLSGDGKYLLSGSSDDHAYIWRIGAGPKPLLKLEGHGAEVTCVAWCSNDITKIVTCADDVRHRIWRLNSTSESNFDESLRIKGRAKYYDANASVPQSCQEVMGRVKRKINCKTPSSITRLQYHCNDKTPDDARLRNSLMVASCSPRSALSPLTPNVDSSRGASRRLEMTPGHHESPTRNLPNYVMDGMSPASDKRTASKRKNLDWLTDLSRKITPNKQRRIK